MLMCNCVTELDLLKRYNRQENQLHCSIEGYDTQKVTLLCIVFAYLIPNLHRRSVPTGPVACDNMGRIQET